MFGDLLWPYLTKSFKGSTASLLSLIFYFFLTLTFWDFQPPPHSLPGIVEKERRAQQEKRRNSLRGYKREKYPKNRVRAK